MLSIVSVNSKSYRVTSTIVLGLFVLGQILLPISVLAQSNSDFTITPAGTFYTGGTFVNPTATNQNGTLEERLTPAAENDIFYSAASLNQGNSGGGSGNNENGAAIAGAIGGAAASVGACLKGGALGAANAAQSAKKVPVVDKIVGEATTGDNVKSCMLDGMAFQLKEALVKGIIQGVIGFINSGFEGGPGYMQDEDSLFLDISDQNFNEFINDPKNFSSQCSAWAPDVRLALAVSYGTSVGGTRVTQISGTGTGTQQPVPAGGTPEKCTLDSEGHNSSGSSAAQNGDFWSDFLSQTTNTGGNPLTSFLSSQDRLAETLDHEAQKKKDELTRGRGFFDSVDCSSGASSYSSAPGSFNVGGENCTIKTPSATVESNTNDTLMSDLRRLELADEFDEVFSQLVAILIQMILGKLGLSGVSEKTVGKSGVSQSFIEQYAGEVNNDALVKSREDLLILTRSYRENAAEYVRYKKQSIAQLVRAREKVLDTYACYFSKYNTWVYESSGYLIDADDVDDVPVSQRKRATYLKNALVGIINGEQVVTTVYLTPTQVETKIQKYESLLAELDGYILTLQNEVSVVEQDIAKVIVFEYEIGAPKTNQEWLENTISSSSILTKLQEEFANNDNTVTINSGEEIASELNVDYSLDNARTVIQKFNNSLEIRLKTVGLTNIVMTLRGDLMDFPDGVNEMPLTINFGFNNSDNLTERPVVVTRGEITDITFDGLQRSSSYSFSFTVDDDDFESFDGSVFTIGTNTTGTYAVPQNLTVEQILQTYLVLLEEMTVYDVALAYEQTEQIIAANESLLLGQLGTNGVRGGGVEADLESCREFNSVVQPIDPSTTTTNNSTDTR